MGQARQSERATGQMRVYRYEQWDGRETDYARDERRWDDERVDEEGLQRRCPGRAPEREQHHGVG